MFRKIGISDQIFRLSDFGMNSGWAWRVTKRVEVKRLCFGCCIDCRLYAHLVAMCPWTSGSFGQKMNWSFQWAIHISSALNSVGCVERTKSGLRRYSPRRFVNSLFFAHSISRVKPRWTPEALGGQRGHRNHHSMQLPRGFTKGSCKDETGARTSARRGSPTPRYSTIWGLRRMRRERPGLTASTGSRTLGGDPGRWGSSSTSRICGSWGSSSTRRVQTPSWKWKFQ